ncbi:hypothetical protein K474DRAFT_334446 [Panus rudis PR-1116 ss-1]|nr:hypothetical protein K474DRAFT_334446 [Panus rudis PR-1116 ss-1]
MRRVRLLLRLFASLCVDFSWPDPARPQRAPNTPAATTSWAQCTTAMTAHYPTDKFNCIYIRQGSLSHIYADHEPRPGVSTQVPESGQEMASSAPEEKETTDCRAWG